jgi:hypothetical protein
MTHGESGQTRLLNRDLDFYGALQPLQRAEYYFTKAGQPIVGDLYEDLGAITAQVSMSHVLAAEVARLHDLQTKATRVMRLACDGHATVSSRLGEIAPHLDG